MINLLEVSLAVTTLLSTVNMPVKNGTFDSKFESICSIIPSWENSYYSFNSYLGTQNDFKLFDVLSGNDYKGYFVTDNNDNISTFYVGEDKLENYSLEDISPIFSSDFNLDDSFDTSYNINNISTNSVREMPVLNTNLYSSYSNSYCSTQEIINCPEYYNYPYGPVDNGCAPTTGAMLVSFYDRYTNMSNLVNGLLPLEHSDNKTDVDKLIVEMANYMKTDTNSGTSPSNEVSGLTNYFKTKGYGQYKAYYTSNYEDYSYIINTRKNPAFLRITAVDDNGGVLGGHAVLGTGTANIRDAGRFMITHYNWKDKRTGQYYVSSKYFVACIYMGK